ncbi:hypothetical protein LIA77_09841 [Sarocladium implicatum]|nr:hypothetical protein LIA77_09841 [Sarocladium implicatum]
MEAPIEELHPFKRSDIKDLMTRRASSTPPAPVTRTRTAPVVIFISDSLAPDWAESSNLRLRLGNQYGMSKALEFYDLGNLYDGEDYMERLQFTNRPGFSNLPLEYQVESRKRSAKEMTLLNAKKLVTSIASEDKPLLLRLGWQHRFFPETREFMSHLADACMKGDIPIPKFIRGQSSPYDGTHFLF